MCVYGNLNKNVREQDKTVPISYYGISKLTSEEYIKFYPLPHTTKVVLRLFNVYGPGSDKKSTKHGMVGIYLNQINIENPHFFIFENNNAVMMFKYLLICVCFI